MSDIFRNFILLVTLIIKSGDKLRKSFFLLVCVFLLQHSFMAKAAADVYPLNTPDQQARFQYLIEQLRCVVCQNQNLADSNAPLAEDLRQEIATMISRGEEDKTIVNYLVTRYGDFILFKPPLSRVTYLLWFGPFMLLLLGLAMLLYFIRKRQANLPPEAQE